MCEPKTCEELEVNCGAVADGCGDIIECGDCEGGHVCGLVTPNVCSTDDDIDDLCHEIPRSEACDGRECGVEGDGCGGTYDCGSCDRGDVCGLEDPFICGTPPDGGDDDCPAKIPSCADVDAECGIIGNGCGGTIDCDMETGGCDNGQVCGFGGPQKCGDLPTCTPTPAATACAGKCGLVSNGCGVEVNGGLIDCTALFPCPMGQTCGGGGVTNQCGAGSSSMCTPIPQATACAGKTCGTASDGCTSFYTCGSGCGTGQACINGGCQGTTCQPIPRTTACAGMECGQVGDGCSGTHDCGTCPTGESCGLRTAFTCDPTPGNCVPRTPAAACSGKECGIVYDGCGTAAANQIDCSTVNGGCGTGEYCGLNQPFQCDSPTIPPCVPTATSCAELGWACGNAINNCGTVYNCALENRGCSPLQACVGGITGPTTCESGTTGGSCPLCSAVPDCSGRTQLTQVTGRVITPGRTDAETGNQVGVPNAFVYILRENNPALLPAISSGVGASGNACDRCEQTQLGPVLVSAMTTASGHFTLEGNIPVGQEFVLVVKVGKFRRAERITIPASAACTTYPLPQTMAGTVKNPTRLPRFVGDGDGTNIPRVAVSTGQIDAMECVLHKMGLTSAVFSHPQDPNANARVHLYRSNGAYANTAAQNCLNCGTTTSGTDNTCRQNNCGGSAVTNRTAYTDLRLFDSQARMTEYDMVVFDCEQGGWDSSGTERSNYGGVIRDYVDRGGRMFASHLSFSWLNGNGTLNSAATWNTTAIDTSTPSGTGRIAVAPRPVTSPRITNFTDWMTFHGLTNQTPANYTFALVEPRSQATGLGASTEEFVYRTDGNGRTQQFSFNTPYGSGTTGACGRVAYSGFHVTTGSTGSSIFPAHCSSAALTAQEKILLYMLFDLGGCVGQDPTPPGCTEQACPGNGQCGTRPNGCGGTLQCGCPQGQACVNGSCQDPGCVPTTCAAEGIICSTISDGCGGALTCACPVCTPISQSQACAGKTCGFASDGCSNVYNCGGACTPTCVPLTDCPQGIDCGIISDGCDGTLNCGNCPPPAVCGGAGQANRCGIPMCDPLTCEDQGAECGLVGDGCGGSDDCGPCPAGQVCTTVNGQPNRCTGCEPLDCDDVGAECGTVGDGCGGIVDCGDCPSGQICGITTPYQCGDPPGCDPATCESEGAECGLIGDGCGELVDCGPCPSGSTCGLSEANKCAGVR
jgi:hypothetical protein